MIRILKTSCLAAVLLGITTFTAYAQNDLVNFLQAGAEDASMLTNAYLNPFIEGLSYSLNGGWYHTAKAHKPLGFDLSVTLNAVTMPDSKRFFDPAALDLQTTTFLGPGNRAPTMIGPEVDTQYEANIQTSSGQQNIPFDGPPGLDLKKNIKVQGVLAPMAQLGIGIYKNTDLKIRFMPEITVGSSSKLRMIGFGVLHDVKQHIPGIKILPFDLSVMVGYTRVSGTVDMSSDLLPPASNDTRPQQMPFEVNAWLAQALISKKLAIFTFYGGVGYNAIKSKANLNGSYTIFEESNGDDIVLTDPLSLSFDNKSFCLTGGFRMSLGGVFLKGDYTVQEYNRISVGVGFTFR